MSHWQWCLGDVMVTDELSSYGAALGEVAAAKQQETGRCLHKRTEDSLPPCRGREGAMLGYSRMWTLEKFISGYASKATTGQRSSAGQTQKPFHE